MNTDDTDSDLSRDSNTDNTDNETEFLSPHTLLNVSISAVEKYYKMYYEKTPSHTSVLTGHAYVKELLESRNPRRQKQAFRMPISTFRTLCDWFRARKLLSDEKKIKVEEQVAIFMDIVGKKATNSTCQERYQHSGETISGQAFIFYLSNAISTIN
jgi:hypothetical protein